jgi:hypothetical protein
VVPAVTDLVERKSLILAMSPAGKAQAPLGEVEPRLRLPREAVEPARGGRLKPVVVTARIRVAIKDSETQPPSNRCARPTAAPLRAPDAGSSCAVLTASPAGSSRCTRDKDIGGKVGKERGDRRIVEIIRCQGSGLSGEECRSAPATAPATVLVSNCSLHPPTKLPSPSYTSTNTSFPQPLPPLYSCTAARIFSQWLAKAPSSKWSKLGLHKGRMSFTSMSSSSVIPSSSS